MRDSVHTAPLPKTWQDKAVLALSLFLVVSPWLLGYSDVKIAAGNAVVVGLVMAAGAAAVLAWRPYWPDFFAAFLAFWLAMSPRIMGFSGHVVPTAIADITGAAVVVLALWAAVLRSRALMAGGTVVGFTPPARPPISPDRPKKAA